MDFLFLRNLFLGSRRLQSFYSFLFKVAVKGMNYDRGHVPEVNGEEYVLKYIKDREKGKKILVFDVGANRGQYARVAIKTLKDNYEIFSFEPQKMAFAELSKVLEVAAPIKVFNFGMGSQKENKIIYKNNEASVFASFYKADYTQLGVRLTQEENVAIETLDGFCREQNIPLIDFLKIDVEGYEMEVLKGAVNLLKEKKIKYVQFEFGIASIEAKIFLKDFMQLLNNFTFYRILPKGLAEVKYSEYAELFLCTNYLAIQN